MNAPLVINAIACGLVMYCCVVRLNFMERTTPLWQAVPLWLLFVGAGFDGFAPFFDGYVLGWGDLFTPVGLAGFLLRYVHRVELFLNRGSA